MCQFFFTAFCLYQTAIVRSATLLALGDLFFCNWLLLQEGVFVGRVHDDGFMSKVGIARVDRSTTHVGVDRKPRVRSFI